VQGTTVSSRYYTQVGLSAKGGAVGFSALIPSRKEDQTISFFPYHFQSYEGGAGYKGSCFMRHCVLQNGIFHRRF
jgi:hypothetical protein